MTDLTARTADARRRIGVLANEIGYLAVSDAEPAVWAIACASVPNWELGWTYPILLEHPDFGDLAMTVGFCPEFMAAVAADLPDDLWAAYMDGVEWIITMHCALHNDKAADDEAAAAVARHQRVEKLLAAEEGGTGTLAILDDVRLAALLQGAL